MIKNTYIKIFNIFAFFKLKFQIQICFKLKNEQNGKFE